MGEATIGAEAPEDHRNSPLNELSNGWAIPQWPNPVFRELSENGGWSLSEVLFAGLAQTAVRTSVCGAASSPHKASTVQKWTQIIK